MSKNTQASVAAIGGLCLLELLAETAFGLGFLTTGAPLANRGVLVELPGTIWFLAFFVLKRAAWQATDDLQARRLNTLCFLMAAVGLGLAIWAAMNYGPPLDAPWQYLVAFACLCVIFVSTTVEDLAGPIATIAGSVTDAVFVLRQPATWGLVGVTVVLLAFGPTLGDVPSRRVPSLRGQALLDWYDMQPRIGLPSRYKTAPVVVATFLDYECPACLAAERQTKDLFLELRANHPGLLDFVTLDYPLEEECNSAANAGNLHPSSCEAAAAMRVVASTDQGPTTFREWLWDNQAALTPEAVIAEAKRYVGADAFDAQFESAMQAVKEEVAIGNGLGLQATPAYWINGVTISRRTASELRAIILHEIDRVRAEKQLGNGPSD